MSIFRSFSNFFKRALTPKKRRDRYAKSLGFTLIELLVIMIIVGVLSTIAAPAWLGFVNSQRLNSSQTRVFQAIKTAQSDARIRQSDNSNRTKITFTTGITSGAYKLDNVKADNGKPQSLEDGIVISSVKANGVTYSSPIEFDSKGFLYNSDPTLNLVPICINLSTANTQKTKWIKIQTLLGATTTGADTCS